MDDRQYFDTKKVKNTRPWLMRSKCGLTGLNGEASNGHETQEVTGIRRNERLADPRAS